MICSAIRFVPAVFGMAIDIAVQMRRHNRMVAAAQADSADSPNSRSK